MSEENSPVPPITSPLPLSVINNASKQPQVEPTIPPSFIEHLLKQPPVDPITKLIELEYEKSAKNLYDQIQISICSFEETLDSEHEVGFRLTTSGGELITLDQVGYWNPSLMMFSGWTEQGERIQLLQHVSQVNILLVATSTDAAQKRKIGFIGEINPDSKETTHE